MDAQADSDGALSRGLAALTRLAFARPGLMLGLGAALIAGALAVAGVWLKLLPGHHDLVDADAAFHQRYRAFEATFGGDMEFALLLVATQRTPDGRAAARAWLEDFAARSVNESAEHFRVSYRMDVSKLRRAGLWYLDAAILERIAAELRAAPWMGEFAGTPQLAAALHPLPDRLTASLANAGGEYRRAAAIAELAEAVDAAAQPGSDGAAIAARTWVSPIEPPATADGYFDLRNGRYLLALIELHPEPGAINATERSLLELRRQVQAVRAARPAIATGLTGRPVLNADEMITSSRDMAIASLVAAALVAVLFVIAGRSLAPALAALAVLAAAMSWTLGATTLTIGHLNLLSIVFFVILIGLGVDFAVHLAARNQELREAGAEPEAAAVGAARSTGRGLLTAGVSTALAFFAVGLSEFRGIRELGIVSGMGILLSALAAFTVWPALLGFLHQRGLRPGHRGIRVPGQGALAALSSRTPIALGLAALLTAALGPGVPKAGFNGNLLKLQAENLESVRIEREWLSGADFSSWFGVFIARDAAHAAQLRTQAAARTDLVARVDTAGGFLPADTGPAQGRRVEAIGAAVPRAAESAATAEPFRPTLGRWADAIETTAEWVFEAGTEDAAALAGRLESAAERLRALSRSVADAAADHTLATHARLDAFWQPFRRRLGAQFGELHEQAAAPAPTEAALPAELRSRFIAADGRRLVQIYPKKSLWDDANLREFCDFLAAIDPEATGVPFQVRHSADLMFTGYRQAAWYALIAIAVLLLLDFRSITDTLLALIPVACGAVWGLGVMGWLGIEFNLANLMAIPLLLGIGVDTGVHLVHRHRAGDLPEGLIASSTGHAVGLSGITTMIGFGSLLLAQHGGLRSLGLVMVIGLAATMVAGLLVLPAVLRLLTRER